MVFDNDKPDDNLKEVVHAILMQKDSKKHVQMGRIGYLKNLGRKSDSSRREFKLNVMRDSSFVHDLCLEWLRKPGGQFNLVLQEDLKKYLNPGDSALRDKRLLRFKNALQEAIKMSKPLITINNKVLERVHDIQSSQLSQVVTDIPVAGDEEAVKIVEEAFKDFSKDEWNISDKDKNQGQVEIFTMFKEGYDVTVFGSVWRPIMDKWVSSSTEQRNITGQFWNYRRSRPLPHFAPLSKSLLQTMIRGWFVAKVLDKLDSSITDDGGKV